MAKRRKAKEQQRPDMNRVITVGLPLPEVLEYNTDVSPSCRACIDRMARYMTARGFDMHEMAQRGVNVADNHNKIAQRFVGDWLLICGSDHTFAPNALELLWRATQEPPYPRIVGAIIPFRTPPYSYVVSRARGGNRERQTGILPFVDFHPGQCLEGVNEVIEVTTIGSGFCLYHRSVFDTLGFPWFLYTSMGLTEPRAKKLLMDSGVGRPFPDLLEDMANGRDVDPSVLRDKAADLREAMADVRNPYLFGPDYHVNILAGDYGIKSYCHLGVTVFHTAFVDIHLGHFIERLRSGDDEWWKNLLKVHGMTYEGIAKARAFMDIAKKKRDMDPGELIADYKDQPAAEVDGEDRTDDNGPVEADQGPHSSGGVVETV